MNMFMLYLHIESVHSAFDLRISWDSRLLDMCPASSVFVAIVIFQWWGMTNNHLDHIDEVRSPRERIDDNWLTARGFMLKVIPASMR
jgi:hypothetical protein